MTIASGLHRLLSWLHPDRTTSNGPRRVRPNGFDVMPSAALAAGIVLCGTLVFRWLRFTLFSGTEMTDVRWEQTSLPETAYLVLSSCLPALFWILVVCLAVRSLKQERQFVVSITLVGVVLIVGELDMAWYQLAHRHATINDARAFITEFGSWRDQYGISISSSLKTVLRICIGFVFFLGIYYLLRRAPRKNKGYTPSRFRLIPVLLLLIGAILADSVLMGYAMSKRRNQWIEVGIQNPLRITAIDRMFLDQFADSSNLRDLQLELKKVGTPVIRPNRSSTEIAKTPVQFDILLLAIEGLNSNLADAETTPKFTKFAAQAIIALDHYSTGNVTEYGALGLLYGEPLEFYRGTTILPWRHRKTRLETLGHSRYLERLSRNGYRTRAIAPGVTNWADVSNYLSDFTEPALMPTGIDGVSEAVAEQLQQPGLDFVFAYYAGTHFPYKHAKQFSRFQPEVPETFDFLGWDLHAHQEEIRNRYRNCLQEFDSWLAHLLDRIDLTKTIVVITGDHGEEFFERGRLSHASSLDKPQISTPLVLYVPGRSPAVITKVTSHLDVMETLLHMLNLPPEPGAYGRSIFLDDPLAHAAVAMMNRPETPNMFAIVTGKRKMLIDTTTKRVIAETDPNDTELPYGKQFIGDR